MITLPNVLHGSKIYLMFIYICIPEMIINNILIGINSICYMFLTEVNYSIFHLKPEVEESYWPKEKIKLVYLEV